MDLASFGQSKIFLIVSHWNVSVSLMYAGNTKRTGNIRSSVEGMQSGGMEGRVDTGIESDPGGSTLRTDQL